MDHLQRIELEAQIRRTLKEHQQDGLHMIGGANQLVSRLLDTVEAWIQSDSSISKKTA